MARRDIDTIWDRETRNNINENFKELYNEYIGAGLDAKEARQKAEEALSVANQSKQQSQRAEDKADNVQEQFNQVVIEGDSSVEAAQARVDINNYVYDTLKERLDAEQSDISSKFKDIITVNHLIDNTGNVTNQLQNLIDNSPDGTVLEFKGTYEIDHIVVNKKDLRFTSRGSTFLINDTSQKGLVLRDADNLIIDGINFEVNFDGLPENGDHNRDFFIYGTGKNVKILNCTAKGLGLCRLNYADGCIIQNNKVHSGTTSQEIYDSGHNRLLRGIEIDNTYNFRIIGNDVYNFGQDGIKTQIADRDGVVAKETEVGYILFNYVNGITSQDAIDTYNNGSRLVIIGNAGENCQKLINCKKEIVNDELNSFDNIISNNIFKGGDYSTSVYYSQMGIQIKSDNCIVKDNIIYDVKGRGIHVRDCDNVVIEGNEIHDIYDVLDPTGDTGVGIEVASTTGTVTIGNNDVHNCDYIGYSVKNGDFNITGGTISDIGNRGVYINPNEDVEQVGGRISGLKVNETTTNMTFGIFIGSNNKIPIITTGCYVGLEIQTPFIDQSNFSKQYGNSWNNKEVRLNNSPNSGTFERGDIVYNSEPWPNSVIGWVCTAPGTNKSISGITGSIDQGSNILTVNDSSDFAIGEYINIQGISSARRINKINRETNELILNGNANTTVVNSQITYKPFTFNSFGKIE